MLTFEVNAPENASNLVVHPWFYPAQPPVIVALGEWQHPRSLQALLQAFSQVRSRQQTQMIVLGHIPDRSAVESWMEQYQIEPWIALPGLVNNSIDYLNSADVGVIFNHSKHGVFPFLKPSHSCQLLQRVKHAFMVLPTYLQRSVIEPFDRLGQPQDPALESNDCLDTNHCLESNHCLDTNCYLDKNYCVGQSMITPKAPQRLAKAINAVLDQPDFRTADDHRMEILGQTGLLQTLLP